MYGGSGDADDPTSSESEPDLDTVKTSPSVHTAQIDNPFKGKQDGFKPVSRTSWYGVSIYVIMQCLRGKVSVLTIRVQ